ncbi:Acyl-CoA ligase sidI [Colletotrichum siamense]|nr:Acyl-CoA ligase sidI [Colletotrichum siamense]
MANIETDRAGMAAMAKVARSGGSIIHGPDQPGIINKTFGNLIREQARKRPDALLVASHHQRKSLTYAQANDRSDRLAQGLASLGVQRGDRVAILMGNEIEYVEIFFACTKLGALVTLVNYAYTEQELHSVMSSCGVSVLVMVPGFDRYDYKPWIRNLKAGVPSLETIIVAHSNGEFDDVSLDYEEVVRSGMKDVVDLLAIQDTLDGRDMMNLQFTSGSTGLPKAAALTHQGIYNTGRFIGDTMYLKASDRVCLPVPFFHSFGLIIGLATVAAHGASIILPDNHFNIEATLACIPIYQCTGLYGVTTMFVAEMAHPNFTRYNLDSLRFAILAGSAVPEALMRHVWSAFGITQTHTNWGMTEASSIVTMTRDTDTIPQRTITSGRLFPGFSARIADPSTGRTVPWGERGEILLRGYGVQTSYYGNDAMTGKAHKISDEDGLEWFHTGDEGYLDEEGFFVITGRIKDMIIRGGENIAPLEIEERLVAHPAISQAAVIGVPDEKYGEQICAFVEPSSDSSSGSRPMDRELQTWVAETLARFKQPKYIIWLGSHADFCVWPKTASGKLRKPDLRLLAPRILETKGGEDALPRARL